jgi:hypothetical protein
MRELAVDGIAIPIYQELGNLPHFNPDLEGESPSESVRGLRALISRWPCLRRVAVNSLAAEFPRTAASTL